MNHDDALEQEARAAITALAMKRFRASWLIGKMPRTSQTIRNALDRLVRKGELRVTSETGWRKSRRYYETVEQLIKRGNPEGEQHD